MKLRRKGNYRIMFDLEEVQQITVRQILTLFIGIRVLLLTIRKKDSDFDEILDDLFRIGAKNIKRMGHDKVHNRCDDDTSRDRNIKADVDLEEDQEEDGDGGDVFDMWDITVKGVERIRQFLKPNIPDEMDKIVNVTMVDKEADSNPTRDIKELERLLAKNPLSHFTEIQGSNSKGIEFEVYALDVSLSCSYTGGDELLESGMLLVEADFEHGLKHVVSSSYQGHCTNQAGGYE
ncbi:hypothetical protein Tco_0996098 [Tanacetum coccineum]